MGQDVERKEFTSEERQAYRAKVHADLDVFARMLADDWFDFDRPMTGTEIELNLTDEHGDPSMRNATVLDAISDPDFQTEVGAFNLEINVRPGPLRGLAAEELERDVRASLNNAEAHAASVGCHIVMIGILPTLRLEHVSEETLSANPRYAQINEQTLAARGEDIELDIEGVERLTTLVDSIAPEGACTSVQFHLQVSPDSFAAYWNAAQTIAGPQVAIAANSPFLFGRRLWAESRIALFEQATDTRTQELRAQGVRPRVWFGERWITSVFDIFEENTRYFPSLLPVLTDEDPLAEIEAGRVPQLAELRLHNGTIWRWNRPVYDIVDGVPHLRVENRVLPAGPTVADIMANGAFYYGVVRMLAEADRPVWTRLSFAAAEDNLDSCAQYGLDARMYWPGTGDADVGEVVLRRLLPLAYEGLDAWQVDPAVRDRLLGIIERRVITGQNGAAWQAKAVSRFEDSGMSRDDALRRMTLDYREHMHSNVPVHEWPLP